MKLMLTMNGGTVAQHGVSIGLMSTSLRNQLQGDFDVTAYPVENIFLSGNVLRAANCAQFKPDGREQRESSQAKGRNQDRDVFSRAFPTCADLDHRTHLHDSVQHLNHVATRR